MDAGPALPSSKTALGQRGALRVRLSLLAFLAVLGVGAAFRFADLGLVRHSFDDSYPGYDAIRMLDGQGLVLRGQPSSVFLDNPPLMAYLQAIPLLVVRSPWAVYVFVVGLNTAALWFVYRTGRELMGEAAGLTAAFLFATNPWIVFFSRQTWVQSLVPFFTAVMAWGLLPRLATGRGSLGRLVAAALAAVAMLLTYVQAWGAVAQLALLLALFRRRISRRVLILWLAALALAVAVYGASIGASWAASRQALAEFAAQSRLGLSRAGWDHALRLVTGRDYDYSYAREGTADYDRRRPWSLAVHGVLAGAVVAGLARVAWGLRRPGVERRVGAVLLAWFGTPVLLMTISTHPVHPHYLLLTCPAGQLLAAWGMEPLLRRRRLWALAATVLVASAGLFGLTIVRANQASAASVLGPEFGEWALVAGSRMGDHVRELTQGLPRPVRIHAEGDEVLLTSLSGTSVTTLRGLDYPHYVVLPGDQPLVYVLVNVEPRPGALGPHEERFPEREMQLVGGARVTFLRALPYSRQAALALPETVVDWPSEAGLTLLGYTLAPPGRGGQALTCTTYWRVEDLPAGRAEWYIGAFYHLLGADGTMLANVSGHGQWGYRWRRGDVYVERASIPVPAGRESGTCRLEFGLFDTIHRRNYRLRSPEGLTAALVVPVAAGD